ncbi:MAG: hypothetical protein ACK6C0_13015 [Betaproteobacteria bacterium]
MNDCIVPRRRALLRAGSGLFVLGSTLAARGTRAAVPAVRHLPLTGTDGLRANAVTVAAANYLGRAAVAVEPSDEAQAALLKGGAGNGPTFALVDAGLGDGTIEVDLAARINGKGQPEVRGFVGIAFHVAPELATWEAIYLRMTNGSRNVPPPPAPRNQFAIQYISYPDRYWRKLRQEQPNRYEQPAPVAIETWHRLRIDLAGSVARAAVDGQEVLTVTDLRFPGRSGAVGLWVDDGTTGYFSDLRLTVRG